MMMGTLHSVPSMSAQDLVDNKPLPKMVTAPPGTARVDGDCHATGSGNHGMPSNMFEAEQMAKNSIRQGSTGVIGLGSLSRI
jgi:hypothetical protein